MTFKLGDRIRESTTTTGTGALALGGADVGFATFASRLSTGDTTWYALVFGASWEVGIGTFTSPSTLARTTVIASTNSDAALNLAAGTKEVFVTAPASALLLLNNTALKAVAGVTPAVDKLAYFDGASSAALTDLTSQARTLLGKTSQNAMLQYLGGPWELVSQTTVSGSPSSIDFTGLSGTLEHRLLISGIRPASNDTSCILQVQTGGSTWQTSGYVYSGRMQGPGGGADTGSTLDSYTSGIILNRAGSGQALGNSAGYSLSGEIAFVPGDTNQLRKFRSTAIYTRSSDGVEIPVSVGGNYGTASAITGVRLILGTGAWANVGKIDLIRRAA